MLRPGRLLAPLKRTFTFELSPVGSPRTDVEYDYVGRQPVPTTGLPPASHAALWAAQCPGFPADVNNVGRLVCSCRCGVLLLALMVKRIDVSEHDTG